MSLNRLLSIFFSLSGIGIFYLLVSPYLFKEELSISFDFEKTTPEAFVNLWESKSDLFSSNTCLQLDEDSLEIQIEPCFQIKRLESFGDSPWSWRIESTKLSEGKLELYPSRMEKYNNRDPKIQFANQIIENEVRELVFLQKSRYVQSLPEDITDRYETLRSITDSLGYSQISFNTPSQMNLKQETPVILLASNFLTKNTLSTKLDSILGPQNKDSIETHRIKSTSYLEAQLTGQNFSVTSGSPVRQPVFDYDITKWEWLVEPKTEGTKFLTLTINLILNVNGVESPYTIQTFRKEINVTVQNKLVKFYTANETFLLWLFGIVFTFASVYFGYWLERRKSKVTTKTN